MTSSVNTTIIHDNTIPPWLSSQGIFAVSIYSWFLVTTFRGVAVQTSKAASATNTHILSTSSSNVSNALVGIDAFRRLYENTRYVSDKQFMDGNACHHLYGMNLVYIIVVVVATTTNCLSSQGTKPPPHGEGVQDGYDSRPPNDKFKPSHPGTDHPEEHLADPWCGRTKSNQIVRRRTSQQSGQEEHADIDGRIKNGIALQPYHL